MGPLLFVWSVPTVVLFALFLGVYKATGLIDRITTSIHPAVRWCGLTGRDLIRIAMGFGCNVPAVISTRACSSDTRKTCISAIAFGSACSYQLGATLAVFGAAGHSALVLPYLAILTTTTLIYTKLTTWSQKTGKLVLVREGRAFLEWPRPAKVWREARGTVRQFFGLAIPVFLLITFVASILDWLGVIERVAGVIAPAMALFHLPAAAALPIVFASIRKDGILLFAQPNLATSLTPGQLLTGVYLAGVFLPCIVTAFTTAREQNARFVAKLLVRQATAALAFSLILSWTVAALGR
jgi:Fe2+ transport system protein B